MRFRGTVVGFAFSLLVTVPAWAADVGTAELCAVSGPNGKFHAEGGAWDADGLSSEELFSGVGSFSFPLGCMFGLQVDAGAATFGDVDAVGAGAHVFVRDPTSYLLGVHGNYENWDINGFGNADVYRIGGEAELYARNFSLEGWAGYQHTDFNGGGGFAKLTAAYYVTDDLRLDAGVGVMKNFTYGAASAEWQLPDMPVSFTAEGRIGEDDYAAGMIGVKFYFGGEQKALINRHREDDPDDGLFDFIGAAGNAAPVAPPPVLDGVACDNECGD
jgi:hypothetical protein